MKTAHYQFRDGGEPGSKTFPYRLEAGRRLVYFNGGAWPEESGFALAPADARQVAIDILLVTGGRPSAEEVQQGRRRILKERD